MKINLKIPSNNKLKSYLLKQSKKDFSYPYLHYTKNMGPKSFDNDHTQMQIGKGDEAWEAAKKALLEWRHFPSPWTTIYNPNPSVEIGKDVAVLFRILGIWWINSARIVYMIDEPNLFGFAYGTLPGHIERGEEVFYLERNEKAEVFYHIKAFSQPAYLLIWMVYPMARFYQRKFVQESMHTMREICRNLEKDLVSIEA